MLKMQSSARRKAYITAMKLLMGVAAVLTCALVVGMIGYILGNGIPNITWEMLSTAPSYLANRVGILPDILSTLYIVIATLLIVLPLGVGAAIYLNEYAANKKLVSIIEYASETLSGIPSIIYGLVGTNQTEKCTLSGSVLSAQSPSLAVHHGPVHGLVYDQDALHHASSCGASSSASTSARIAFFAFSRLPSSSQPAARL